ncbi:MAG TPA: hypothetical protein P5204_09010 [Kiritimatiellia bacterium]|nr:hypothetical protein [Kiritimatiellia bacterium]
MSDLLHSPRHIPDLYAIATRDYAPDPAAWDIVMEHDHQRTFPPQPGDRPGLIGFGDSTSGKTSTIMIKLKQLRKGGCIINFLSSTELATVVRESASDYRSFAAISSYLCGKGPDEDLADAYCDAICWRDPLKRGVEISKFLCAYPQVEEDPLFRKWFSPDGLFLDDLHIPRFTDAYARTLYDIIEKRTANFHALLLTSQLSAQQLYDKWKNDSPDLADTAWAIINRINQRCVPVQFVKGAPAPSLLLPGASKGRPRQSAAGRTPERAHGHPRAKSRTESKS